MGYAKKIYKTSVSLSLSLSVLFELLIIQFTQACGQFHVILMFVSNVAPKETMKICSTINFLNHGISDEHFKTDLNTNIQRKKKDLIYHSMILMRKHLN